MTKKARNVLTAIISAICAIFMILGATSIFGAKAESVKSVKYYQGFEGGDLDGWFSSSSKATLTIDNTIKHTGNNSLKATLNAGQTQNRIEKNFPTGKLGGIFEENVNYTFEFYGQSDAASTFECFLYFNNNNGTHQDWKSIEAESMGASWVKYTFTFKYWIKDGHLYGDFTRSNGASWKNFDLGVCGGDYIKSIDVIFYGTTTISKWWVDDISIYADENEVNYVRDIINTDFENEEITPFFASSGTTAKVTTETTDNKIYRGVGRYIYKSLYAENASGGARVNAEIIYDNSNKTIALNDTYYFDMTSKTAAGSIDVWITLYFNGTNKGIKLVSASGSPQTTTYEKYSAWFKMFIEGNELKLTFKRPDMDSPSTTSFGAVDSLEFQKFELALAGNETCTKMWVDDVKLSKEYKGGVSNNVYDVIQKINAIGVVGDDSLTKINAASDAYAALSLAEKKEVYNYDILREAQGTFFTLHGEQKATFDEDNIVYRFGVASDVHSSKNLIPEMQYLSNWKGVGMDGLMISGDITDGVRYYGTEDWEIDQAKSRILDNVKAGLPIAMSLGNHDSSNASKTAVFYDKLGSAFYGKFDDQDRIRNYGNGHMMIGKYHFIVLENDYDKESLTEDAKAFLKTTMAEITARSDYNGEYIFIITHLIPADTLVGPSMSSAINTILKDYPQAMVIGGHNHVTPYDELNINQKEFTALNAGGTTYSMFLSTYYGREYIELTHPSTKDLSLDPYGVYDVYELPCCLMIEVDKNDNFRINRIDIAQQKLIGEPWIISKPQNNNSHLYSYTDLRKVNNQAPYFETESGKATYSVVDNKVQMELSFSSAKDIDGYIYSYTYAFYKGEQQLAKWKNLSNFFLYPDLELPEGHAGLIKGTYALSEVPDYVLVYPCDNLGKEGEPIKIVVKDTDVINGNRWGGTSSSSVGMSVTGSGSKTAKESYVQFNNAETYSGTFGATNRLVSDNPVSVNGLTVNVYATGLTTAAEARDIFGFTLASSKTAALNGIFNAIMWQGAWNGQSRFAITSNATLGSNYIAYIDEAKTSQAIYNDSVKEYVFDQHTSVGVQLRFKFIPKSNVWQITVSDIPENLPQGVTVEQGMWTNCKKIIYVDASYIKGTDGSTGGAIKSYFIGYSAAKAGSGRTVNPCFNIVSSAPTKDKSDGFTTLTLTGDISSALAYNLPVNADKLKFVMYSDQMDTTSSESVFGIGFASSKNEKPYENNRLSILFTPSYNVASGKYTGLWFTKTLSPNDSVIFRDQALTLKGPYPKSTGTPGYAFNVDSKIGVELEFIHLGVTADSNGKDIWAVKTTIIYGSNLDDKTTAEYSDVMYFENAYMPSGDCYLIAFGKTGATSTNKVVDLNAMVLNGEIYKFTETADSTVKVLPVFVNKDIKAETLDKNGISSIYFTKGEDRYYTGDEFTFEEIKEKSEGGVFNVNAVFADAKLEIGAAINASGTYETSGIRFESTIGIKKSLHGGTPLQDLDFVSIGIVVMPIDLLEDGVDFTVENYKEGNGRAANKSCAYVEYSKADMLASGETSSYFRFSILDLNAANFNRKFVYRFYIKLADGKVAYYSFDKNNARSISQVAAAVINDDVNYPTKADYPEKLLNSAYMYYEGSLLLDADYKLVDEIAGRRETLGLGKIATAISSTKVDTLVTATITVDKTLFSSVLDNSFKSLTVNGVRKQILTQNYDEISGVVTITFNA